MTFTVHATDPAQNASDSAPATFRICGAEPYGTPLPNSTGQAAHMMGVNDPSVSTNNFKVTISGLLPGGRGTLLYGTAKVVPGTPWGNGLLYIGGIEVSRPRPRTGRHRDSHLASRSSPSPRCAGGDAYFHQVRRPPRQRGPSLSDASRARSRLKPERPA